MCLCAEILMTPKIKRQHLRINLSIINFNSMEIQCRCFERIIVHTFILYRFYLQIQMV